MLVNLLTIDRSLLLWCIRYQQNPLIIRTFREISRTGDGYLYAALGLLAWWLDAERGLAFLTAGVVAFAIEIPAFITLKKLIRRDRPFVSLNGAHKAIDPSDKFSLPSDHTTAAFVMACLILAFYPQWALPAFVWASLIGSSRVVLGVHYPTDILAGAVLGLCCASLALMVLA